MSSRHHLTSVADGTARAFAERNNDVDGWWTLGLLLAAVPPGDPDYGVDLLTGEATPALDETVLAALGSQLRGTRNQSIRGRLDQVPGSRMTSGSWRVGLSTLRKGCTTFERGRVTFGDNEPRRGRIAGHFGTLCH